MAAAISTEDDDGSGVMLLSSLQDSSLLEPFKEPPPKQTNWYDSMPSLPPWNKADKNEAAAPASKRCTSLGRPWQSNRVQTTVALRAEPGFTAPVSTGDLRASLQEERLALFGVRCAPVPSM
jgi:hypothetical protein